MPNLQRALETAVTAHANQKEKNGAPYALHPIRVALALENEAAQIVALLHDVVEDTTVSLADLANEGFAPEILEAVELLTHTTKRPTESEYNADIERIATNPLARAVKLADLTDNMNVKRIAGPLTEKDLARLQKYHRAWTYLREETTG